MAIEAAGDPDRPALNPARELRVVTSFADQVNVVALDRELADPERTLAAAVDKRSAKDLAQLEPTQACDVAANPHGDEYGKPRFGHRPRGVPQARPAGMRRLAPSAGTATAVRPELHLLLTRAPHLIGHSYQHCVVGVKH
jgi:hypothetical protein